MVSGFTSNITAALHEFSADADDGVDLRELLHQAVVEATRRVGPLDIRKPWDPPSAAMVLAHVSDKQVRLLQSADVAWQVRDATGVVSMSVSEPVFAGFEAHNIAAIKKIAPGPEGDAQRREVFRATRAKANAEGGYPVVQYGMAQPLAVKEGIVHADAPELVLYSDGWPRLYRNGLEVRLHGDVGFDDATFLHVRAAR